MAKRIVPFRIRRWLEELLHDGSRSRKPPADHIWPLNPHEGPLGTSQLSIIQIIETIFEIGAKIFGAFRETAAAKNHNTMGPFRAKLLVEQSRGWIVAYGRFVGASRSRGVLRRRSIIYIRVFNDLGNRSFIYFVTSGVRAVVDSNWNLVLNKRNVFIIVFFK